MTLAPGTTVGRYQILEPLGQGGMATVYKAFQPSLDREVALKVLRPGYAQDAEFKERFEREAKAVAKLRHPNIVQVHDFEVAEGQFVLAMEFLDGGTLKDRLSQLAAQGRGIDANDAVRIIWEVADALSYAHDLGVIHRDVKPSNVMLARPRDRAVVTDFGIARILGATSHTQTGVGIGTPEYMAPEQGQGGRVDHRADIYSLGAMAYEIFTGRVPYTADTPLAVVLAHMKDPLPIPSKVNPSIGPSLERAILKALAKDPAQRFDTAIAFAEAVRNGLASDTAGGTLPTIVVRAGATPTAAARAETAVAPSRLAANRPALLIAGAAAALLLLGGGALVAGALGGRGESRAEPTAAIAVVDVTASSAVVPTATLAPTSTPTPAPTPRPLNAIPAKGALLYEAALDGTSRDLQAEYPLAAADASQIRLRRGAIEAVVLKQGGAHAVTFRADPLSTYVAELDLAFVAGPSAPYVNFYFDLGDRVTPTGKLGYWMRVDLNAGGVILYSLDPSTNRQADVTGPIPVSGALTGRTFTLAAVVESQAYTLYLDQRSVVRVEPGTPLGSAHLLYFTIGNGMGAWRVHGARFYALP